MTDQSLGDAKTKRRPVGGSTESLALGTVLGQYRIVRLLGRGGMGEVYEVEHQVLRRRYALKLLPATLDWQGVGLERFQREAQVMANLEHPNILRVDEFGETNGGYWLRMEMAEGVESSKLQVAGSKSERIVSLQDLADARGGKIPQEELLDILKQILAGLEYAHVHGAIHRDLKPANILLFPNPQIPNSPIIKITDFGLVRLVGEEWVRSQAQLSVRRSLSIGDQATMGKAESEGTSTRSLLGTYEYMSPEQKRGEEADPQSDLYAMGLMTFKLLTGRNPGTKPPTKIDPDLVSAWDELVESALEEEPRNRCADDRAFQRYLEKVAAGLAHRAELEELRKQEHAKKDAGRRDAKMSRFAVEAPALEQAEAANRIVVKRGRARKEQSFRAAASQAKESARKQNPKNLVTEQTPVDDPQPASVRINKPGGGVIAYLTCLSARVAKNMLWLLCAAWFLAALGGGSLLSAVSPLVIPRNAARAFERLVVEDTGVYMIVLAALLVIAVFFSVKVASRGAMHGRVTPKVVLRHTIGLVLGMYLFGVAFVHYLRANTLMPRPGHPWRSPSTGIEFVWIEPLRLWVGKYEVTNSQYQKYDYKHNSGVTWQGFDLNGDSLPALLLPSKVEIFLRWINASEWVALGPYEYRLPTENEWVLFASCGDFRKYPWGSDLPPKYGNYNNTPVGRSNVLSGYQDNYPASSPVSMSGVNEWGLFGIGGNMQEPVVHHRGDTTPEYYKGGAWNDPDNESAYYLTIAASRPTGDGGGLRLVLSPQM